MVSENCNMERRAKVKKKCSCKYKQTWEKDYSFIRRSQKGDEYAKCNSCRVGISVARVGKDDVMKHVTSETHKKNIAAEKKKWFVIKGPEESDKLNYAETKFAMFVAKKNLPFSIYDRFSKIVSDMFSDSELAKKYDEAEKTKTSQIIKDKRRGNLKNLNCRPSSKQKGDLKFVELILLWSIVYKDWDCCRN